MEEWVKIRGRNTYSVSTFGRVRHDRIGRYMREVPDRSGRPRVLLTTHRGQTWVYIEELVAWAFIPRYNERTLLVHLDGDVSNNALDNLRPSKDEDWRTIPEASRYEINAAGDVRRIGGRREIKQTAEGNVALYDRGERLFRSAGKIRRELFGR